VADRFFPSSKTCSACGMVKAKLSLTERVFTCERCGLISDRDVNAAKNLFLLAVSGRGPGGAEVRPSVMLGTRRYRGSPRSLLRGVQSSNPAPRKRVRLGPPPGNWWLWVGWLLMTTDSQRLDSARR
jgi:putative transposase